MHKERSNIFTDEEEKNILQTIEMSVSENIPLSYIEITKIIMQLHIDTIKNSDISTIYENLSFIKKKFLRN